MFGVKVVSIDSYDKLCGDLKQVKDEMTEFKQRNEEMETELKVTSDKLYDAYARIKELEHDLKNLDEVNKNLLATTVRMQEDNAGLYKVIETLESKSDKNTVEIRIDDSLTKITPVVYWKESVIEKLIEVGRLNDVDASNKIAVQLGLMLIAQEGLEQIIEQFEEPVLQD